MLCIVFSKTEIITNCLIQNGLQNKCFDQNKNCHVDSLVSWLWTIWETAVCQHERCIPRSVQNKPTATSWMTKLTDKLTSDKMRASSWIMISRYRFNFSSEPFLYNSLWKNKISYFHRIDVWIHDRLLITDYSRSFKINIL